MSEPRFDVIYSETGISIDYHFCREWDENGGCYGTNPNHGFTFEEAKKAVVDYYQQKMEEAQNLTLAEWEDMHCIK